MKNITAPTIHRSLWDKPLINERTFTSLWKGITGWVCKQAVPITGLKEKKKAVKVS